VSIVVDITEISAMVAAAGVLVGVVYYVLEIRHQGKMRQTDLVIRLADDMRSAEVVAAFADLYGAEFKDYDEFVKKYGMPFSKNQVPMSLVMIGNYFEELGVLFSNKLLDAHLVDQLFPTSATWEKMEPFVKGLRKEYQYQEYFEWFEYLYNEMKKREQRLQQRGVKSG
jgi:hypothetical protein